MPKAWLRVLAFVVALMIMFQFLFIPRVDLPANPKWTTDIWDADDCARPYGYWPFSKQVQVTLQVRRRTGWGWEGSGGGYAVGECERRGGVGGGVSKGRQQQASQHYNAAGGSTEQHASATKEDGGPAKRAEGRMANACTQSRAQSSHSRALLSCLSPGPSPSHSNPIAAADPGLP